MPTLPYFKGPDGVGHPVLRVWKDPRIPWFALVDSGADGSALPLGVAEHLEIPFDRSVMHDGQGAGGVHQFWRASEDLELQSDAGLIRLEKPTINANLAIILLGRGDVFMQYRVAFDQRAQTFVMTPYAAKKNKGRGR